MLGRSYPDSERNTEARILRGSMQTVLVLVLYGTGSGDGCAVGGWSRGRPGVAGVERWRGERD